MHSAIEEYGRSKRSESGEVSEDQLSLPIPLENSCDSMYVCM